MSRPNLPEITETKETLGGARQTFRCRLVDQTPTSAVLLFVSEAPVAVAGTSLPAGTVTFGFFWGDRPYNVYHWMSPAGQTLGHYFNLADRTRIEAAHLSWRDLAVDILLSPDGQVSVLDEDELPPDLDSDVRGCVDDAKRHILTHAKALTGELESISDRLWAHAFGGRRA